MGETALASQGLPGSPEDARRALARLDLALILFVSAGAIGGPWDMLYHITNPFDSFLSAPHLFIYGTALASMILVISIAIVPRLRACFGKAVAFPLVPVAVPGSLILLGGGLFTIAVSGALDGLWHTAFRLDETRWSTPHAMFGWGLLLATLGFTSARMALRPWRPIGEAAQIAYGLVLTAFSLYAFLLPFMVYPTRATLDSIAALPVIQGQPDARHTFRIYTTWGVDHSHPLFAALAALWAGFALSLLRALGSRGRTVLVVTGLASALYAVAWYAFAARLETVADPRSWLPLPIFLSAAFLSLAPERWGSRPRWALAGAMFGGVVAVVWGPSSFAAASALLSVPSMLAGAWVGTRVAAVVESPSPRALRWLLPGVGFLVPVFCGTLDLYLRLNTP